MSSGKHLICDIKEIKNLSLVENLPELTRLIEEICDKYNYTILNRAVHRFQPQGITILYMLSESHIALHTFPENRYVSMDIYTCRCYEDNTIYNELHSMLIQKFDALYEPPVIIDRKYMRS